MSSEINSVAVVQAQAAISGSWNGILWICAEIFSVPNFHNTYGQHNEVEEY